MGSGPACVTLPGVVGNKHEKKKTLSAAWEETEPGVVPGAIC